MGAGERPFFVAEEFRFQNLSGNRAAVDRNKRACRAGGILVERVGNQLLAGARLTHDQHRRTGWRRDPCPFEKLFHRRRVADDALEPEALFEPLAQPPVFVGQDPTLELQLNPLPQLLHLDRFGQIVVRPLLQRRHRGIDVGVRRDQEKREEGVVGANRAQELVPVHPRHANIGDDGVHRIALGKPLEGLFGGWKGTQGVAHAFQGAGHRVARPVVVIHQKNHCRHVISQTSRASAPTRFHRGFRIRASSPCRACCPRSRRPRERWSFSKPTL